MALIVRKTEDGVRIEGDPPKDHVLAANFIARELVTGLCEVKVILNTSDGPVTYSLQGFEPRTDDEASEPNLSAWVLTLDAPPKAAKSNG